MVADMSYSTVSSVIDSWEEIRRLPNYEEKTGVDLFVKWVYTCTRGAVAKMRTRGGRILAFSFVLALAHGMSFAFSASIWHDAMTSLVSLCQFLLSCWHSLLPSILSFCEYLSREGYSSWNLKLRSFLDSTRMLMYRMNLPSQNVSRSTQSTSSKWLTRHLVCWVLILSCWQKFCWILVPSMLDMVSNQVRSFC